MNSCSRESLHNKQKLVITCLQYKWHSYRLYHNSGRGPCRVQFFTAKNTRIILFFCSLWGYAFDNFTPNFYNQKGFSGWWFKVVFENILTNTKISGLQVIVHIYIFTWSHPGLGMRIRRILGIGRVSVRRIIVGLRTYANVQVLMECSQQFNHYAIIQTATFTLNFQKCNWEVRNIEKCFSTAKIIVKCERDEEN